MHVQGCIRRAAFIVVAFPLFVAAQAFPLPVQHEAETGSREAANAAHLARFDAAQFFKQLFAPFVVPPAPAVPSRIPAAGTILRDSLRFEKPSQASIPTPQQTPAATPNREAVNVFLKAVEEARKKGGGTPQSQGRQPTPEQIQQIVKLFEEAGRKAAAEQVKGKKPQPTPTPSTRNSNGRPLLPVFPQIPAY